MVTDIRLIITPEIRNHRECKLHLNYPPCQSHVASTLRPVLKRGKEYLGRVVARNMIFIAKVLISISVVSDATQSHGKFYFHLEIGF